MTYNFILDNFFHYLPFHAQEFNHCISLIFTYNNQSNNYENKIYPVNLHDIFA